MEDKKNIAITADSTCDLPDSYVKENEITVIPLSILLGDKVYHDGVDIKPADIYKYVDTPVNSAKANIIRESIDAIEKWETRIKIDSVTVEIIETQIKVKIQWSLKSSNNTKGTAEVNL